MLLDWAKSSPCRLSSRCSRSREFAALTNNKMFGLNATSVWVLLHAFFRPWNITENINFAEISLMWLHLYSVLLYNSLEYLILIGQSRYSSVKCLLFSIIICIFPIITVFFVYIGDGLSSLISFHTLILAYLSSIVKSGLMYSQPIVVGNTGFVL